MLAKRQRLNLRLINFPYFFKDTKKFSCDFFKGFYRWVKTDLAAPIKIAAVVPKTVSLKAVERNKIKRTIYRKIELNLINIEIKKEQQLQLIVFAQKKIIEIKDDKLADKISSLFKQIAQKQPC